MTIQAGLKIKATKAAAWAATTDITRFAWVYDPEGNNIELWEPKG